MLIWLEAMPGYSFSPMGTVLPQTVEQMALLESAGGTTYLVEPDEKSRSAIGPNPLSLETPIPAAEAGRSQGHAIAQDVGSFWGKSKGSR